jgi:hypothetical protein
MCEILLLWLLGRAISDMAGKKMRSGLPYVLMLILFWFGGEVFGGAFGLILMRGDERKLGVVYICALFGAACGAVVSFLIVGLLPRADDGYELPQRRRPRRRRDEDEDEDDRPRRRRDEDDRPRRRRRDDDTFESKRDF